MEVHRPKPFHGWRELSKEVGIIVLGVLIALGAEQIVQSVERHHRLAAAEEAMRLELVQDDGPQAWGRYLVHRCVDASLDAIRDGVERRVPRATLLGLIGRYRTPFWTWDSLAFAAANSSDVALHMRSDALHRWTMAYAAMPALNQANAKEFNDGSDLAALSKTGGLLTEAEESQVLHAVETLRRDNATIFASVRVALPAIQAAGVRLDPAMTRRVQAALAKEYFGSCIDRPPSR